MENLAVRPMQPLESAGNLEMIRPQFTESTRSAGLVNGTFQ